MATYTDSYGFAKGVASVSPPAFVQGNYLGMVEVLLDFAKIKAARAAAGVAALGAADVLEIIPVAAGTDVLKVGYEIIKPEGATFTFDLGDGTTPAGYLSNQDGNAAAGTVGRTTLALTEGTPNTVTSYSNGKLYTAADTIDIVLDHASVDTAIIRVWAQVMFLKSAT